MRFIDNSNRNTGNGLVTTSHIYRLFQIASVFCIFSGLYNFAAGQISKESTQVWYAEIKLTEQTRRYVPVSNGSVISGLMVGSDKMSTKGATVYLPNYSVDGTSICIRIETHDGTYTGKGRLQNEIRGPGKIVLDLSGDRFRNLAHEGTQATLIAWRAQPHEDCETIGDMTLLMSSWDQEGIANDAEILVNSTGMSARVALLEIGADDYRVFNCNAYEAEGINRIYDAICQVPICQLANAERGFIEIRNRNQRVHLERLSTAVFENNCRD